LYEAPEDAEFTFVLKLDGALAKKREYRVFDSSGSEIFQDTDGAESADKPSNWTAYRTDRSGTFTLKAGQMAKFEYVGTGVSYEVTEIAIPDQFIQIQPAQDQSVVGTMVPKGARADFTNLYTGREEDEDNEEEETSLVIRKNVSFPSGYEALETPDFTFCVKISGKPWSEEAYTVTDIDTGEVLESGLTDPDGTFTMRGGCMATFDGIPVNADYEVTEDLSGIENWRSTGSLTEEGATAAPVTTVVFSNVSASFAVTKQLEDGSKPDTEFTFELSDAEGGLWQNAEYYLYTTAGSLAEKGVHKTNEQGRFVLKAGQAAIFVGIPAGTKYSVREIGQSEYTQVVPASSFGYQNKTVVDSVEVLPFVNKKIETYGLNVTKLVESDEGRTAVTQDEFTFVLYKKTAAKEDDEVSEAVIDENAASGTAADGTSDGDTAGYEPVRDAVYSIESGTSQLTYKTDENGTFTIKANETARFAALSSGTYKVEEIDLPAKYSLKESTVEKDGTVTDSNEGELSGGNLDFTFTNVYTQSVLLPETGRSGSNMNWYTLAGVLLMLSLLFMYKRAGRKEAES
jgi:LPXTG-motif cell wall-anchored protein